MENKKKILLFIDELGSGGAQRQIVYLAKLLKSEGYAVSVVDYWNNTFYDKTLTEWNIPFYHQNVKGKLNIIRAFLKAVKQIKPDVVISYMENPSIVACIGKSFSFRKFKLIVSERNTTQSINNNVRIRFALFRIFANHIVVNSGSQFEFIKSNYPKIESKSVTITNVIDTRKFAPSDNNTTQGTFRFVVVARIVEQKNVKRFIEAVRLVTKTGRRFVINWYGKPYPENYFESCKELIAQYNLEGTILFHQPTNKIVSKYQESDAFILPSVYEGFPNVLCEAMSCGLPVIASNVCDNPRILGDCDCGYLVDPFSPESISEAMIHILDTPKAVLNSMGNAARQRIVELCSEKRFVKAYSVLIES